MHHIISGTEASPVSFAGIRTAQEKKRHQEQGHGRTVSFQGRRHRWRDFAAVRLPALLSTLAYAWQGQVGGLCMARRWPVHGKAK